MNEKSLPENHRGLLGPRVLRLIRVLSFSVILLSLVPGMESEGGKVYRWVDEKGVVHFSDRKPDRPEEIQGPVEEREVKEILPVEKKQEERQSYPNARSPIEYATNGTFTIRGARKTGTGFFISSTGYALTCRHVIDEDSDHVAQLNDQTRYPLRVIGTSRRYDLALLSVLVPQQPPPLSLRDPATLVPGERLFAIGASAGLQATITDGVFTGFRKIRETEEKVIQFSAPINQGNSGGPLIDEKGQVVGVVTWKFMKQAGIPVSGVGFAIPSVHITEEYGVYVD